MKRYLLRKLRPFVYAVGIRPNPGTILYDRRLEAEEQWRTGKK
jgi:hypothetical protein